VFRSIDNGVRKLKRSVRRRGWIGTAKLIAPFLLYRVRQLTPSSRTARRQDLEFDRTHGVDTSGMVELSDLVFESDSYDYGHSYQPTSPGIIREMLGLLPIRHEDFVFIDIGSGKGRALFVASEFPFKQIIGIEFAPQLHEIAQRNIGTYRNPRQACRNVQSICVDATQYEYPNEPIVFYLYNPFAENIMTRVMRNIRASLDRHPRAVYLAYQQPLLGGVIEGAGFTPLRKMGTDFILYG